VLGADAQTDALAKIGIRSSGADGVLTMDTAKGSILAELTNAYPAARVPLRNPGDAAEEDFPPAGFCPAEAGICPTLGSTCNFMPVILGYTLRLSLHQISGQRHEIGRQKIDPFFRLGRIGTLASQLP